MEALIGLIVANGLPTVISAIFLGLIIYFIQKVGPMLVEVSQEISRQQTTETELKNIAQTAISALDRSTKNDKALVQTLETLDVTMKALTGTIEDQRDFMMMMYADQKEMQKQLYDHDKRAEKLYTMVYRLYCDTFKSDNMCKEDF